MPAEKLIRSRHETSVPTERMHSGINRDTPAMANGMVATFEAREKTGSELNPALCIRGSSPARARFPDLPQWRTSKGVSVERDIWFKRTAAAKSRPRAVGTA